MDTYENATKVMKSLIPTSLISEIACFVFYDNHPRDEKNIDVTICTKSGEIREYFQRDLQSSLELDIVIQQPAELSIARNSNSELFYLLSANDEFYIISSDGYLQIRKILTNVERYEITDPSCSGSSYLKIIKKDDAVPLIYNNNFELEERGVIFTAPEKSRDSYPIFNEVKSKLVEARYAAKCNEKAHTHYLSLHQQESLLTSQNQQPSTNDHIFQDNVKVTSALKLKSRTPWVKICNKKILLVLNAVVCSEKPICNLIVLVQNTYKPTLIYKTKVFIRVPTPPYWQEPYKRTVQPDQECAILAVIDLDELQQNVFINIELSGSVVYEMNEHEYLVPFDHVVISSTVVMKDEFDVLSSSIMEDENCIIAILAATESIELCFRHIRRDGEPEISLSDLFCTHLQMERVGNAENVVMYRRSPYHALNGIVLIFHENHSDSVSVIPVSVHTRSPKQVLTLLHSIYDTIPAKIVITTPKYRITAKTDDLVQYNEDTTCLTPIRNYKNYAISMEDRCKKILGHVDQALIKMFASGDTAIRRKLGTHIDLYAAGIGTFNELKDSLREEADKSILYFMDSFESDEPSGSGLNERQEIDSLITLDSPDENMDHDVYLD